MRVWWQEKYSPAKSIVLSDLSGLKHSNVHHVGEHWQCHTVLTGTNIAFVLLFRTNFLVKTVCCRIEWQHTTEANNIDAIQKRWKSFSTACSLHESKQVWDKDFHSNPYLIQTHSLSYGIEWQYTTKANTSFWPALKSWKSFSTVCRLIWKETQDKDFHPNSSAAVQT